MKSGDARRQLGVCVVVGVSLLATGKHLVGSWVDDDDDAVLGWGSYLIKKRLDG